MWPFWKKNILRWQYKPFSYLCFKKKFSKKFRFYGKLWATYCFLHQMPLMERWQVTVTICQHIIIILHTILVSTRNFIRTRPCNKTHIFAIFLRYQYWSYRPESNLYCFLSSLLPFLPSCSHLGKHYFLSSFCVAGVSGSCVIPSLARSALHLIPGGICPGYLFPLFRFFRHF